MPERKTRLRRKPRRRRYERKMRRYRNTSMFAQKGKLPIGKRFLFKTRYYETDLSVNPTAGGFASSYVFSANGLYDPNITGTGHQPVGFDQLMTMYDHYTVIGARIRAWFANEDTGQNQVVGIYASDGATTETDPRVIIENGMGKYTYLHENGNGASTKQLVLKLNPNKFLSVKSPTSDDRLKGSTSSNPTEQCYFHVWGASTNATDSGQIRLCVEIEYIALLTEPKTLALS